MKDLNFKKKYLVNTLLVSVIVLIILGVSYAYFTANLSGIETATTINVNAGTMDIAFSGGSAINLNNIYPRAEVWGTKIFTVTGNNTTGAEMKYNLTLVINNNTFTSGALEYYLKSYNTDSNGTVALEKTDSINTGSSSILLGNCWGNKIHTYNLEIYFPETGENQNIDQGKSFGAYVLISAVN